MTRAKTRKPEVSMGGGQVPGGHDPKARKQKEEASVHSDYLRDVEAIRKGRPVVPQVEAER